MASDARTTEDIWAQIHARAEELRRSGTLLPTIARGVRNEIIRVDDDEIERASESPRTKGASSAARRIEIGRIWERLRVQGSYDGGGLRFAMALFQLVDGVTVRDCKLQLNEVTSPSGYWWSSGHAERYWVEIRHIAGIGTELRCPASSNAWYRLLDDVHEGDVIYHWHARQSRFVGRSVAAGPVTLQGEERVVPLVGFRELVGIVDLPTLRAKDVLLYSARDELERDHPSVPHYLPFQYRGDGIRLMSNYFAKMPRSIVEALFGEDGWAMAGSQPPPDTEGDDAGPLTAPVATTYLNPFKAKADADYVVTVLGGPQRRGRHHETLVNDFAVWLKIRGLNPGRNQAIDLGTESPPVIIEAKVVKHQVHAIREAVSQLYEYRFFQAGPQGAALVFLASKPVEPKWLHYLETDRHIGAAWPEGQDFVLSRLAAAALGL